ncbi:patatin-like phospholipase family protein [Flavihumibacter petaseus]|uniref:PNPLA domain-containing protein n=1 Tax=Flavihumibacter petaseus NBRC 106054 TaxID=1220578 RepID=A0A0E9N6I3_9BACT|nr:patatin-like phospholipase family protein [Flavihumibacter petaseus]GAO45424.1 hypothetical protein FPE01S_05_01190 [Flavihumibacter petaseus NBRC 106054]
MKEHKLGLSLSGGGYRASAFHLGTLKKLHDMKILPLVDVLSTISGGSITGACYCCHKGSFDSFYQDLYLGLQTKNVIRKILFSWMGLRFLLLFLALAGSFYFLFTPQAWLFPVALALILFLVLKYQFNLFPISKRIEEIYDEFFYQGKQLGELETNPTLVIGATNLQTARPFTFSKNWMQDSTYQFLDEPVKFKAAAFPVARAVMASSCVPFAFTPVTIDRQFFLNPADADTVHPILVDGGVYDNQGIHKVMQKGSYACDTVITSDAGSGSSGELHFVNTLSLLMETVNVFMSRIKNAQMVRNVYDNASTANRQVAYFSLGWDAENCIEGFIRNLEKKQIPKSVVEAHELPVEWQENPKAFTEAITLYLKHRIDYDHVRLPDAAALKTARSVSTNLTALSKKQVDGLIAQAEALTEIQVKLYCPVLIQQFHPVNK